MAAAQASDLRRILDGYVGTGAERPGFVARNAVSKDIIRQMTDAVGDRNPIYTDEAFARSSIHGGIVAPPTWLHGWSLPALEPETQADPVIDGIRCFTQLPGGQRRKVAERITIRDELNELLARHGFDAPAVTNMEFEYARYLRPGDLLHYSSWTIEEIAGPKATRLGEGFFVTISLAVTDQGGNQVATVRQTYLRSKPVPAAARPAAGSTPDRSAARAPALQGVGKSDRPLSVGDVLPLLRVDITPTLIIAGALAGQDFQDVHHDVPAARRRGHPDIFMNVVTTSGLIGRFVTDWAGPHALIKKLQLRLGRPNYPGDQMLMTGTITSLDQRSGMAAVAVLGRNRLGDHVTSTVTLALADAAHHGPRAAK